MNSYSKKLCEYVIKKEQADLLVIFDNFADNTSENNTFYVQHEILEDMLTNIKNTKGSTVTIEDMYRDFASNIPSVIASLEIEQKLDKQSHYSKELGVSYFDEEIFMEVLSEAIFEITARYNLNANDDYNKVVNFLESVELGLESSDDKLISLANQYKFYKEHSNGENDEALTIYNKKIYKFSLLEKVLDSYKTSIGDIKTTKQSKSKKR